MATVKIRGRADIIEIDNSRAQQLKNRKFGLNGTAKAEPLELVDLGEWAGEYGRIVEIIIPPNVKQETYDDKQKKREEAEQAKWLKLPANEKAKGVGQFNLLYAIRIGNYGAKAPEELIKKAVKIQEKFYTDNPEALQPNPKIFEGILPDKTGESLSRAALVASKKMKVDGTKENGRACENCGKPLTGNLVSFCSGSCQLEHLNGKVPTS